MRAALAQALERGRVSPAGQRLPHLLACAELEEIACSGPRAGKQPTWRALDEVSQSSSRILDRSEALRELAIRYFTSRGPATSADFGWWSGLPTVDVRTAIEAAAPALEKARVDDVDVWLDGARSPARAVGTHLLPAFDEWLVAYRGRAAILDAETVKRVNAGGGLLAPCVVHEGRVVGTWRRTLARSGVDVTIDLFEKSPVGVAAVRRARERYVRFVSVS